MSGILKHTKKSKSTRNHTESTETVEKRKEKSPEKEESPEKEKSPKPQKKTVSKNRKKTGAVEAEPRKPRNVIPVDDINQTCDSEDDFIMPVPRPNRGKSKRQVLTEPEDSPLRNRSQLNMTGTRKKRSKKLNSSKDSTASSASSKGEKVEGKEAAGSSQSSLSSSQSSSQDSLFHVSRRSSRRSLELGNETTSKSVDNLPTETKKSEGRRQRRLMEVDETSKRNEKSNEKQKRSNSASASKPTETEVVKTMTRRSRTTTRDNEDDPEVLAAIEQLESSFAKSSNVR